MSTHAAQFLAVELAPAPAPAPPAVPVPVISAPGTISIHLGEARIDIGGGVEREALRRVIDCLRESTAVPSVRSEVNASSNQAFRMNATILLWPQRRGRPL